MSSNTKISTCPEVSHIHTSAAATMAEAEPSSEQILDRKKKRRNKRIREETVETKLEVIAMEENKSLPIVGYFPSGFLPTSNEKKVKVFENKRRTNRKEVVVSPGGGSRIDFVGKSYAGEANNPQACTLALGVLDKDTNVLKIVPIASNKIFRLEPRVRGLDSSEKEAISTLAGEPTTESMADKQKKLNELFGTKKAITRDKKRDALNCKEDPESKADQDERVNGIQVNEESLLSATAAPTGRNIPPYDLSASTPAKAYPLEKIILSGEWDYLSDIWDLSKKGAQLPPNVYPTFVCNRFNRLNDIQDEEKKGTVASIFSFITHLIKFKEQHSINASAAKGHRMPDILRQRFSKLFAHSDSRRLSDENNTLLIGYVLVLALHADDFETDPADIAKDLRMSVVQLRNYAENLGCKYVRKNLSIMLSAPLKFPELRKMRGR